MTASGGGSGLLRLGPYQYVKQRLLGYPRRPSATDRPRFCIVHDFSDGMIVNSGPLLQALVNNGSTAGDSLDFQVQRDTTLHELVSEIDACSTVITLSGAWRGTLAFANPGTRFIEIVGPAANSNDTALDPAWLKSLDLDHQQARLTGLKAIGARDAFVPVEELLAVVRAA